MHIHMVLTFLLTFYSTFVLASNVDSTSDYAVSEVVPGIFYHQGVHQDASIDNIGAIANVGFIIGEQCVAVIDSGGSYVEGTLLLKAIKQHTSLPICYVINTHVHPDHLFGNAAFKDQSVEFIGHEKLPAAITSRQPYFSETFQEILGAAFEGVEFIAPSLTVAINKPITLNLGKREIILTSYSTGHTDHDLTVLDSKTATLWTGDLLFIDRTPAMDGSINGWISIMDELLSMNIKTIIPGHGTPVKENWQAAIEKQRYYFSSMREQIRTIIYDFGTIDSATKTVGLDQKDQWELFDNYHRRNITASFVELEWE